MPDTIHTMQIYVQTVHVQSTVAKCNGHFMFILIVGAHVNMKTSISGTILSFMWYVHN